MARATRLYTVSQLVRERRSRTAMSWEPIRVFTVKREAIAFLVKLRKTVDEPLEEVTLVISPEGEYGEFLYKP